MKPKITPPTKEEAQAFAESDGNCNTCKFLKRIKHDKDPHGFLYGHCEHNPFGHMFTMKFHPKDPMHMRCYVPRWEKTDNVFDYNYYSNVWRPLKCNN